MSASPHARGAAWREADTEATPGDPGVEGAGVLRRLARRDAAAMVDLHQLFGAPLFSLALRMLDDRGDAEEVLQDAFVRIWERVGEFDPGRGRPFTWCCLILRGCCIDRLRRRKALKRGGGKIIRLDPEVLEETASTSTADARSQAVWREQIDEVRRALATLHPQERRCIEQAIFRGKTHLEISTEGGQPLGSVKSHIRRGMIKLRKKLHSTRNQKP